MHVLDVLNHLLNKPNAKIMILIKSNDAFLNTGELQLQIANQNAEVALN